MKKYCWILFVSLLFFYSNATAQSGNYSDSINRWHQQRIQDLKAPDGWINLVGLFWLQPGINHLGSSTSNELILTHPNMPARAGYFEWVNQEVYWVTEPGITITENSVPVNRQLVYSQELINIPQLTLEDLRFTVIARGDKIGIRMRDLHSPALDSFHTIPRFPVNRNWKLKVYFEPRESRKIEILNVLGQVNRENSPGKLAFTYQQKTYRLDVLEEGNQWFILFADATSGKTTYPTGRFLYVSQKKPGEEIYIDFNQAFNPPCAFTPYATCPLPPPQNRLSFAVNAGEQYQHDAKK
ncbi:MAG: DUF1684 domain-containing protein [Bacteroidetes bacterium]|nr:DUF1684 domain-containing protein [Bacteroidota bacterium]